jgi:hypothetical protein
MLKGAKLSVLRSNPALNADASPAAPARSSLGAG